MAVNIARPTTGLGTGLYSNTASAVISADSTEFAIKAFSTDLQFNVPIVETTGSGDTSVTFMTGGLTQGTFRITGCMVVGVALGLAKLNDQDTASGTGSKVLTPDPQLTINFGGHADNNFAASTVYIDSIQIQHRVRQNAIVGVVLSGRFSGVDI